MGETEIGLGGTTAWRMNSIYPTNTVAVFFEINNTNTTPIQQGSRALIQYTTVYQHSSGAYRLRVTTTAHGWGDPATNLQLISTGFDQVRSPGFCGVLCRSAGSALKPKKSMTPTSFLLFFSYLFCRKRRR